MTVLIMGGLLSGCSSWEDRVEYDSSIKGESVEVTYDPLNLREEPHGKIIGKLEYGTKVNLTGNSCEATTGADYIDTWYEIEYVNESSEVITGWVFTDGITKS